MANTKYIETNKVRLSQFPVDIHGRAIAVGQWIHAPSNHCIYPVHSVEQVSAQLISSNYAGFRYAYDGLSNRAGAHVEWEIVGLPGEDRPHHADIKRDNQGRPILRGFDAYPTSGVKTEDQLTKIMSARGHELDNLAREMGTMRAGDDDSDEELQEQLIRELFRQGGVQVVAFIEKLGSMMRRTRRYPDSDRDRAVARVLG